MTRPDSAPTVPTLAGANDALSVAPPAALAALPNPALGRTACHDLRGAHSGTAHTPHSGEGMDLMASRGQSAPRGSNNTDRCCVVQRRQCSCSLEPQERGTTHFCQLSEATEYDILLHV